MLKKIKNIILETDLFLYKKFGSYKSVKPLENIKEAKVIFSCLNEIGKESNVRFVGGCVRKVLCGESIDDVDLATSLEPDEVKKKLNREDIKVVDTGISHGTVTAILNKKKFEIELQNNLKKLKPDLICLAGFMKVLSPFIIKKWKNKIDVLVTSAWSGNKNSLDTINDDDWNYDIEVNLNIGNADYTVYTCDLTHDYIEINADYRN